MRHKASSPFADFLHRLPRAAAIRLEAVAEGLPVRALTTLVVVTGLGIGAYVALSPLIGGPSTGQSEVAVDAAATDAEEPLAVTQAPRWTTLAVPNRALLRQGIRRRLLRQRAT